MWSLFKFFKRNREEPASAVKESNAVNNTGRKKRQFVSPHPDGGWQVKVEGGKKATKRFKTKAEAEEFAKKVAKNQDTSLMRQKKNGKLQQKK